MTIFRFYTLLLFAISSLILTQTTYANSILLEEDFNQFEGRVPDGWSMIDVDNTGVAYNFTTQNGKLGNTVYQTSSVGEIVKGDVNWTDYKYEFDMISFAGDDRNIIFRWQDPQHRLGFHFSSGKLYFEKLIPSEEKNGTESTPPVVNISGKLPHNMVHHITITVKGRNIKLHLKNLLVDEVLFDFTDNSHNALLNGSIGLRVGSGTIAPSSVWFDNIVVTDLSQPETLNVPHFSQLDPAWKDLEYDHASQHNPTGLQEIGDWGCALTSAAMVLTYHGFDTTPTGTPTTPGSLNQYLKNNNGYTKNGALIWNYISKFSREALDNEYYFGKNLSSLESSYQNYSDQTLTQNINTNNPAILKLIPNDQNTSYRGDDTTHFVVVDGVVQNSIYINDPLDLVDTTVEFDQRYGDSPKRQIASFTPSNTDLSYIIIYQYNPHVNLLVEYNGLKSGIDEYGVAYNQIPQANYYTEGQLSSSNSFANTFGSSTSGAQVLILPQPTSGTYSFTYSSSSTQQADIDWYFFDSKAEDRHTAQQDVTSPGTSVTYTVEFDKENITQTSLPQRQANLDTLSSVINYSHQQNWLSSSNLSRFERLIAQARRYIGVRNWMAVMYLNRIDYLLNRYAPSIDQTGIDTIRSEIDLIKTSLL